MTNDAKYVIINTESEREVLIMTTLKNYFELNRPYKFDPTDITAIIYTLCAVLGSMGHNVTPLFFLGSIISVATCYKARKINLVVLNVALFILNAVGFVKMFL